MGKVIAGKMLEALFSILPVTAIVFLLNFTPLFSLSGLELAVFAVCAALLVFGMSLFNLGAEMSMTPMGEKVGVGLVKKGNLKLLLGICFVFGMLITVAEPDLSVLASQVGSVVGGELTLVLTVGAGVGMFLVFGVLKMIFKRDLSQILMFLYMALFAFVAMLMVGGKSGLIALSFDSGGVTTGPITVPFIMALGVGVARTVAGKGVRENSFGLIALCSIGPILAVVLLGLFSQGELPPYDISSDLTGISLAGVGHKILETLKDVAISLGLMVIFFVILNFTLLRLPRTTLAKIGLGIVFTYVGLVLFLSAVSIGFMPVGYKIGTQIAQYKGMLPVFGFVIGLVVVLAEPAVHVLNKQVEEITNGSVNKRSMMIALSLGVGISIMLSMIREIAGFSILYYLVPGYLISLFLSLFVPKIYTAIAFDSGGVASGPLTSSFILPFAIGVCVTLSGAQNVMSDAFGIVAMVAMTPLITIQMLGFSAIIKRKVRENIAMKRILDEGDAQIINFM